MTKEELNYIKDAFSQIIDDIAGNPDWHEAARAVASDLGTLERKLEEKVSSLPSNLDEAAENRVTENGRFKITSFEKMRIDDIIFGAEWMAGQGIVGDAEVCKLTDRAWVTILDEKQFQNVLYDKFNAGDKVVVQIRKK